MEHGFSTTCWPYSEGKRSKDQKQRKSGTIFVPALLLSVLKPLAESRKGEIMIQKTLVVPVLLIKTFKKKKKICRTKTQGGKAVFWNNPSGVIIAR